MYINSLIDMPLSLFKQTNTCYTLYSTNDNNSVMSIFLFWFNLHHLKKYKLTND